MPAAGVTPDEVLRVAAAVERDSDHRLALAIAERAGDLAVPAIEGFLNLEGKGARAHVEGAAVFLGNRRLMEERGPRCDQCSLC